MKSVSKSSGRILYWQIAISALLMISSLRSAEGATVHTKKYFCWSESGECQIFDNPCEWDRVVFDSVSIVVAPGTPAGEYQLGFSGGNGSQTFSIIVGSDGTGTWNSPSYPEESSLNASHFQWGINAPVDGLEISIDPDQIVVDDVPICGHQTEVPVSLRIGLGAPELPPDEDETEECDLSTDCAQCSKGQMATYFIHLMLASLHIEDTPITYAVPFGPSTAFKAAYNQREPNQSPGFNHSNLGPRWTFNWLSYVSDFPNSPTVDVSVYARGGGTQSYRSYNQSTLSYAPDPQSHAVLVKTPSGPGLYEKRFPDGSVEVFGPANDGSTFPRHVFLTAVKDAFGNAATIEYDSMYRVHKIYDASLQFTELTYNHPSDPFKVTDVYDPFLRHAHFEYDTAGSSTLKLTLIRDPIGIESQFVYLGQTDFIKKMTTPYGDTNFEQGQVGNHQRWIEATDPMGGKERVEYNDAANGVALTDPVTASTNFDNISLNRANTFYWNKSAMLSYVQGDYSKARVTHWLTSADGTKLSGVKHSEKAPLENRVWYAYEGQVNGKMGPTARPSVKAQVVGNPGDTVTQFYRYEYNGLGNVTKETDPRSRATLYKYNVNQIDLEEVHQVGLTGPLLRKFDDYLNHLPQTVIDTAGQTTLYHYNNRGQVETSTNAKGEVTTFVYYDGTAGPLGYLKQVKSPLINVTQQSIQTFTYDGCRIHTITNETDVDPVTGQPDPYTITIEHDVLDRKTSITYPDSTSEEFVYKQPPTSPTGKNILDLTRSKSRRGLWTERHYNGNRQMDQLTDTDGKITQYGWCACGALGSITDANSHTTQFLRDIQGRVYRKVFADSTVIDYLFEGQSAPNTPGTTSRLKSSTDALNRRTIYTYWPDNHIKLTEYKNLSDADLMSPVFFFYDTDFDRITVVQNNFGTTFYDYYNIPNTDNPFGAGKLKSTTGPLQNDTVLLRYDKLGRIESQSVNGVTQTLDYDALGRLKSTDNMLGHFDRVYDGVTTRLKTLNFPNGETANYSYLHGNQDRRLQSLRNLDASGGNLSQFDYTYNPDGQIESCMRLIEFAASSRWYAYDNASRLESVADNSDVMSASERWLYGYDPVGNRATDENNGITTTYGINEVNQVRTSSPHGMTPQAYIYDVVGNLVEDGAGKTFEWDAANHLTAINYLDSGNRTEFVYDGLGHRVKITEFGPGLVADVHPQGRRFATFSTDTFTAAQGICSLVFKGMNPIGEKNTLLIDSVSLNGSPVEDGSFEDPVVSNSQGNPTGTVWNYFGPSGVAHSGGSFLSGSANPPSGSQVAFIANNGWISQDLFIEEEGTYTLSFKAAQISNVLSSQQVRVTLRTAASILSEKTFVWCGDQICEERNGTGTFVTKRFFAEGEQRIYFDRTPDHNYYYYTRDHLGSVREAFDQYGKVRARYDYDAYGNRVTVDGELDVSFGFAGYYNHVPSGLNLTMYRAYDPKLGRWVSRDPIAEVGGINLYRYVESDPVNVADPSGLLGPEAQQYLDIALNGNGNNLFRAWLTLRTQRVGRERDPSLRDAEHFALAAALSRNYGQDGLLFDNIAIPVYSLFKVPLDFTNNVPDTMCPPSWSELWAGYEGAASGFLGYLLHGPQGL